MLMKIRNLLFVLLGAAMIAAITPVISHGQGSTGKDVNVVNTPSVNVINPIALSAGTSVGISSSVANPVFVRDERANLLAFQALDVSFSSLSDLGDVSVGSYEKIRVMVQNQGPAFNLTLTLIEGGHAVGVLDVINVQGACPDFPCGGGAVTTTRVYEVPGRFIRLSSLADQRTRGNVMIFGR